MDDSVGADYDAAAIDAVEALAVRAGDAQRSHAIPARVRALVHFELAAHAPPPLPNPPPETLGTATPSAPAAEPASPATTTTPAPASSAAADAVVPDTASKEAD